MGAAEFEASSSSYPSSIKPKANKYAIGCGILASMTSVLLGYDIGVMSGAAIYIQKDLKLTDVQIEILVGILNVYSLLGSGIAGRTSDWIGRRYTLLVAAVIFFTGALFMGLASNYVFLMAGRFVAGIGVGFGMMIAPVYTTEVSPVSFRGLLTSLPEVFINLGILLGYVSNVLFSRLPQNLSWRFMLGIGALPSVMLGFAVLAMPESARWLVLQGRVGEARKVLHKISDTEEEAEMRLADIKEAAGISIHNKDDVVEVPKRTQGGSGVWKEFLHPTPSVRRIMIAALGLHFFQQASGIDAVVLYSPRIFKAAGIRKESALLGATVAVGCVKTLSILIATFTLDRKGRRPLLLISIGGMAMSLLGLGIGLTAVDQHPNQNLTWAIFLSFATVMTYVSFFSMGMGPIVWVYTSEVFPLRLRAQGAGLGVGVNRVMSGVISMTFLSLTKAITTGGGFLLFAVVAFIAWVFVYTFLPETHGRSLEDVESVFENFEWRKGVSSAEGVRKRSSGGVELQGSGGV